MAALLTARVARSLPAAGLLAVALLAAALLGLALPAPASAQAAILNTETLQPSDVSGFFLSLSAAADLQGGNSDVARLSGSGAIGFQGERNRVVLMGGLSYLSASDSVSTSDRYAQLRYNRFLTKRTRTFHFVQVQASRAQLLRRRVLVGSGLRHAFLAGENTRLDLGAGLMWEHERLNVSGLPPGTAARGTDWRGELLAVASRRLSKSSRLSEVMYAEPRVDRPSDVRVLSELRLGANVTAGVQLTLAFRWRYDSRPPPSVRRHDVELEAGLGALVR